MNDLIKIYLVTFVQYTNAYSADTIARNGKNETMDYIHVGRGSFLITEDEIDRYRNYGGGIKDLVLVGYMSKDSFKTNEK